MTLSPANVFLLDGEDDYAVSVFIASLEERLGSPDIAGLNTMRLDGRSLSIDELKRACFAMPFLASQRLVIVTYPLARFHEVSQRDKLKAFLQSVPDTTLLALVHPGNLTEERDRKKNRIHWLEVWVKKTGGKLAFKHFDLPRGPAMVEWIQARAKSAGGQFTPSAATRLAGLVGDLPRRADQEILKLLEYVNYARPVEADDVEHLTPNTAPVADFALVNALRSQNTRQAQAVLHKMLDEEEPLRIFHNIVNQFRQLIQVRELLDERANQEVIARRLEIHPYVASLAMDHARNFSMSDLESVYQRLHDLDYAIKTGEIDCELALDLMVVELTQKTPVPTRI